MVTQDLIKQTGLGLEKDRNKILEALDGGIVECHGSAAVHITYQGQKTQTRLVVTPKLRNEVILSKTVLQNLSIITNDFSNVLSKGQSLKFNLQASPGEP